MSEDSQESTEPQLLSRGTWTRQGPATLVTRGDAWVVLVPGLRKQVTEATWNLLGGEISAESFLEELLTATDMESVEKFTALLFGVHDGTTATVGVKGSTPIAVHTAEGAQLIAGTEEEPFVQRTLEGVQRVAFGDLPPEEPVGAPRVDSGVVPVRGFVRMCVDPAELEDAERATLAEQVEEMGRSIEDPEAKKRRAAAPKPPPKPATTSSSSSASRDRKSVV